MSGTYHLHKWSLYEGPPDPYQAPELSGKRLFGYRDSEDRSVITSAIIKVDGTTITTRSGSIYILEDIDSEYLKWMNEHGYTYDPAHPIKVKKPSCSHKHQDVNERSQFVCLDCGEELGR